MEWKVEYKKIFLKEISNLPLEIKNRIEQIVFEIFPVIQNPFELGYVEKMTGYKDKYKIRVSSYRIGLTINLSEHIITFQRAAHRKDIYNKFP